MTKANETKDYGLLNENNEHVEGWFDQFVTEMYMTFNAVQGIDNAGDRKVAVNNLYNAIDWSVDKVWMQVGEHELTYEISQSINLPTSKQREQTGLHFHAGHDSNGECIVVRVINVGQEGQTIENPFTGEIIPIEGDTAERSVNIELVGTMQVPAHSSDAATYLQKLRGQLTQYRRVHPLNLDPQDMQGNQDEAQDARISKAGF